MAIVDLTWDQDEGRTSKRKRPSELNCLGTNKEEKDGNDKLRGHVRVVIKKIEMASRELSKLIKENRRN